MALLFYTGGHNSQVFRNPYLSSHPWINLPVQLRLISRRLTSRFCSVGSINPSTVVTYGLHLLTFEQILYQHNLFWTSFLTFRGDLYPVSLNLYGLNSSGYTLLLGLLYPTVSFNLLSTKTKASEHKGKLPIWGNKKNSRFSHIDKKLPVCQFGSAPC